MNRIYHPYTMWEEVNYNMYGNYKNKEEGVQKVIDFFNNENEVRLYMERVVEEFKFSCQHNLTNPNMNKIAFIGQCAVALKHKIPNDITMKAWNFLTEEVQDRANKIAKQQLERWERCLRNI